MKGIIYVRVSSQEQIKGTSLDGQKEACLEYARAKNIQVARDPFIEKGESATAANRTELIKALNYCRENKGEIQAFIVWKIDRFARNMTDHYGLQAQLLKYGVTLHSVSEPMISEGAIGKMTEAVLAGYAQFENDIRRQRCEGGMQRQIIGGIWTWQPPIGYTHSKNRTDRRKTRPDEPDPERFEKIQRGLKTYARGEYNINSLTALLRKWGLKGRTGKPIYKQLVARMLTNKFYAGILIDPWTGDEHKGQHEPMITIEEYNQIQLIKKGLSHGTAVPRKALNPDFPLRQLVTCKCRGKMTGSWQTGSIKKYPYYRCNNRTCTEYCKNIRRADLEEAFVTLLGQYTPQPKFLEAFKKVMIDAWENRRQYAQKDNEGYATELKKLEKRKEVLLQMRVDGEINKEDYSKMRDAADNQITGIRISMNESKIEELDMETMVTRANLFISDLARHWQEIKDPKQKQRFQRMVLPQGIAYDKHTQTFGTPVLSPILELSEKFDGDVTHLVAGVGIAPTTSGL